MKFNLKINAVKTISEIKGYWTNEDYMNLLEAYDFQDAKDLNPSELREILEMAISDFEADEAAQIILQYKLHDKLNEGQIQNLSHEMLEDNEAEEYPDIALHFPLFNINQLLHKAYNGVFPNAKATQIDLELQFTNNADLVVSKEIVLQVISTVLRKHNLIVRLYENEISGEKPFEDADKIVWKLDKNDGNNYTLVTSDYWINNEDLTADEIDGSITLHEV